MMKKGQQQTLLEGPVRKKNLPCLFVEITISREKGKVIAKMVVLYLPYNVRYAHIYIYKSRLSGVNRVKRNKMSL